MLHIIEHSLLDTVKLVPFLFLTYLAMEYLEHKAGEKTENIVRKAGKWGPLIGGVAGVVPQCGFSAAASNLYAGRVISLGTLIAIYLSTSDEMLPIMISERAPMALIVQVLAMKAVIGIVAGFVIDLVLRRQAHAHSHEGHHHEVHVHSHEGQHHEAHAHSHEEHHDEVHAHSHEGQHDEAHAHSHEEQHHEAHAHNHEGHHHEGHDHDEHFHIHEMCEHDHCNCEKDGVFLSAVKHTLQITLFVLLITLVLNFALHSGGEDVLATLLLDKPIIGPVIAAIVGFIPNCAASVVITQLFLEGVIDMGSMMAGLLVNAGVGLVVLFRVNHHKGENLKIAGLLYIIGVVAGIVIELVM